MGHILQEILSRKKLLKFSLEELANKFMANNPQFMMYFGSATTPPCSDSVIHIVVSKPLVIPGCQFKLLRENSLVTSRAKEIHTRVEKPVNDRTVYTFNKQAVSFIPNIAGLVPQSFNRYLLAFGPGYMARMFFKYGARMKGGRYGRWFAKYGKKWKFGAAKGKKPWYMAGKAGKHGQFAGKKGPISAADMDALDCSTEGTEAPKAS